jgi:hypothetical protein
MSEEGAAFAVLGVDWKPSAVPVARWWGLDDSVLHMMRRVPTSTGAHPETMTTLLRITASCANEAVDAAGAAGAPPRAARAAARGAALRTRAGLSPARPAGRARQPPGAGDAAAPACPWTQAAAGRAAEGVFGGPAGRLAMSASTPGRAWGASNCCALGRGAQATVWLAHDPRLDREWRSSCWPEAAPTPTR